jgi:hypothetical protein
MATNKLYLLLCDGAEWEDVIIYDNKEEAVRVLMSHPSHRERFRIEVFEKKEGSLKFTPSYKTIFYNKETNMPTTTSV